MAEADGAAPGCRWVPKLGGRLWRDGDFLKLWAGQSISRLGTFVTALALPTAAIELLGAGHHSPRRHCSELRVIVHEVLGIAGNVAGLSWCPDRTTAIMANGRGVVVEFE
jgi:hypothetical protein